VVGFPTGTRVPPTFKVTRPVLAPAQPPVQSVLWGFFPLACRIWDIRPGLASA